MFDMGLQADDDEPYAGSFTTSVPGVYTIRVRAQGETIHGSAFTREQTVTAVAIPGGGRAPAEAVRDPISDLLCCLFKDGRIPDPLRKQVEGLGIDSAHLERCLRRHCAQQR